MEKFQLAEDVYVKTIALHVNDVEGMVNFYKNVLGFILKLEENNLSILGSQERDSRLLILEETDSEEDGREPFEKSVCFSLLIPTKEEFNSLLRRITVHNYPIDKAIQVGNRQSVFLVDPEGNELEVSFEGVTGKLTEKCETLDIQPLIQNSKVLYSSLSEGVRFDRISLHVEDKTAHHDFYQNILGMVSESKIADKLSMNDGNFGVYLNDSMTPRIQKSDCDEPLGVDFFVLTLNHEEEMIKLKQHLEEQQQEFFVDKKLTILTIYDPSEIEWWFVRN